MADPPLSSSSSANGGSAAPRSRSSGVNRQAIAPVLQFWKAFDLDSKRLVLDTQGSAMKTEKESSLRSRKKLAETTKSFRKLPDPDKIAAVGALLRAYQEEIDSLTKRAKYAENAFFMLYKGLYAAPDPVASLEAAADAKVNELDETNRRLARELREYELEFASLKNQDITIRKLEEQLSTFEHEMDALVHTRVAAQCRELEAQLAARDSELAQQQRAYEQQLESSRSELRDAFSRMDAMQSDLFAHKQRSGLAKSAFDAEMELLSHEAVVTQTLQLENARLKQQLDELLSVSGTTAMPDAGASDLTVDPRLAVSASGFAAELADRDATIQSLRHELFALQQSAATAQAATASERAALQDALAQAQQSASALAAQLAARPTLEVHNDVLHQLHVLQQLEYNIVDDDDDNGDAGAGSGGGSDPHAVAAREGESRASSTSVEKILVARVRRLEHVLQQRELLVQQTNAELTQSRADLARTSAVVDEQNTLLRSLEEHVAALESRKRSSLQPSDVGTEILLDAVEEQLSGDSSSSVAATGAINALAASGGGVTTVAASAGGVAASDNKMLEIVRGQRDRFRERMKELQSDKSRLEELAASCKASVARLENDNMQLYHKIRYLQSYRGSGNGNGSSGASAPGHRVTPSGGVSSLAELENGVSGASGDVEAKYQRLYEEKLNPFVQFNRMETQQRYSNLNTVDKVLLTSAKMFLGHRVTRNIAFGYIVLLHFLVFATLYSFMHGCGISNV